MKQDLKKKVFLVGSWSRSRPSVLMMEFPVIIKTIMVTSCLDDSTMKEKIGRELFWYKSQPLVVCLFNTLSSKTQTCWCYESKSRCTPPLLSVVYKFMCLIWKIYMYQLSLYWHIKWQIWKETGFNSDGLVENLKNQFIARNIKILTPHMYM